MPVFVNAKCLKCEITFDTFADRDDKGYPDLSTASCGECGGIGTLRRNWEDNKTHALIPPIEDGTIQRFEYSFKDENGKKYTKKLDPRDVNRHFQNNSKG